MDAEPLTESEREELLEQLREVVTIHPFLGELLIDPDQHDGYSFSKFLEHNK